MDYYKILNVSRSATLSEIKTAYRLLALKFHPDRNSTDKELAASKFNTISVAYKTLGNINLRRDYDELIGNRHSTWQQPSQSARTNSHSARASQKVRPTARSGAAVGKASVTREQYDVPLWNVWHYGDDPEKFTAFEHRNSSKTATNSKHNRGNATSSSEANTVNWDHFYTRGRSETIMDDGLPYDENASVMSAEERADVTEKLRAKREERRQNDPRFKNTGSGIGGSTKGKDKVDFNANKNDKKDVHVKEEKSGCTIS